MMTPIGVPRLFKKLVYVEITKHEDGWKGSWYRTGQRFVASIDPRYPKVVACKYQVDDHCYGGIHEEDCQVVGGVRSLVACTAYRIRSLVNRTTCVMGGQARNCVLRVQIRYTAWFVGCGLVPSGWSGVQIGLFLPVRADASERYRCAGFELRLLPGLSGAFDQWPAWYRAAWRALSFRSHGSV